METPKEGLKKKSQCHKQPGLAEKPFSSRLKIRPVGNKCPQRGILPLANISIKTGQDKWKKKQKKREKTLKATKFCLLEEIISCLKVMLRAPFPFFCWVVKNS